MGRHAMIEKPIENKPQILLPSIFIGAIVFAVVFFHFLQQYIEEQYASNEVYRQQKIEYMNAHADIESARYRAAHPSAFSQPAKKERPAEKACSNSESEKRICADGALVPMYESGCSAMLCREGSGESEKMYYSPYVKKDRQVFIEGQYDHGLTPIAGADVATFRPVGACASVEMSQAHYGRDRNHIYVNDQPAKDIDVRSFKYLGVFGNAYELPYSVSISVDKDAVYFGCGKTAPSVDRRSFMMLGNGYSRDNQNVYYLNSILTSGVDRDTFKAIDYEPTNKIHGNFSSDKSHVFFEGYPLREVDPAACEERGLVNCLPENWRDSIDNSMPLTSLSD